MNKNEEKSYLDGSHYFLLILKYKRPLIIIALVSLIGSLIFSGPGFIKPRFKSSVIFFPTTTNSVSQAVFGTTDKKDILEFGTDEQAEQLLQILNSDEIRDRVIKKYNLMEHYKIDSLSEYPYSQLYDKFLKNITFERTEFMSVKIEVIDTDAQLAADIANDIAALLDSMKTKIQHVRALEALNIVDSEYKAKTRSIELMEDSLKGLRNKGIFDYVKQSVILNEEYTKASSVFYNAKAQLSIFKENKADNDSSVINTKARLKGAEARMKNLQEKLDVLANLGGANISLTENLYQERELLNALREKYERVKIDANKNLSHKFIVNSAVKAEKNFYPIRWLVVMVSVFLSVLIMLILLILIENISRLRLPKNQ